MFYFGIRKTFSCWRCYCLSCKYPTSGELKARNSAFLFDGKMFASDLSWSAHISTLRSKARQQIGLLYRKFYRYSDVDTLKQLYVAFIRPHLEYATAVWDPHLLKDTQELQSVQCFTCRVCTKSCLPWYAAYLEHTPTLWKEETTNTVSPLQNCSWVCWLSNAPLLYKPCTNYITRYAHHLLQPQTHTNSYYFSFFFTRWSNLE